jgi:hypothetical protein
MQTGRCSTRPNDEVPSQKLRLSGINTWQSDFSPKPLWRRSHLRLALEDKDVGYQKGGERAL